MKILWLVVLCMMVSGCSTFALKDLEMEGALASAVCVEGSGPPMTGSGTIAGAKVNEGFAGTVVIGPNCTVSITSE